MILRKIWIDEATRTQALLTVFDEHDSAYGGTFTKCGVRCVVSVTRGPLRGVRYAVSVTRCPMSVVWCPLRGVRYAVSVTRCPMSVVTCQLYGVRPTCRILHHPNLAPSRCCPCLVDDVMTSYLLLSPPITTIPLHSPLTPQPSLLSSLLNPHQTGASCTGLCGYHLAIRPHNRLRASFKT
jgi:hypothetical protein